MAKLIYLAIASADGHIEDPDGSIDWGIPDEELLSFINELEQPARTYLYGRRMYEAMLYWETAHTTVQPRLFQEFTGIWQAAEKIVFSKTLASVSSARTRVEPAFEPGMARQLKSAAEHDMRVAGADLAGQAIKAGLVDEVRLFLVPVVVGGGKRALPGGVRSDLELLDTQRFASGAVYLRYCLQSAWAMVPIWATLAVNTRPAQAGVTCPRDWRAAAGWETATGPAPGHAQPGRSDRRLTPASRKGPGSA